MMKRKGLFLVCVVFFLLTSGSGVSELRANTSAPELDDIFREGKRLFFREMRLKFGVHPLRFTLLPESIKTLQDAEERLPFLFENLMGIVSAQDQPYYGSLIEKGDLESIAKLRGHFLALCRVTADRFVQSLFQEKSRVNVESRKDGPGTKTRLELILESISNGETRSENGEARHPGMPNFFDLSTQWGFGTVKLDRAHRTSRGKGVRIAVVDSGITQENRLLANALINSELSYCLINRTQAPWIDEKIPLIDRNGHGTVTASLVVAAAPEAEILIYKTGYKRNPVYPYWIAYQVAASIYKAVHSRADVILVSAVFDRNFEFLKEACQFAYENNVVIVCPNGTSSSTDPATAHQFPAHYNTTVAVAGVVPDAGKKPVLWQRTSASHYTTVSAPAFMDHEFIAHDNSWAAAVTAGVAALIMSRIPKSGKELRGQYFQRIYEILTKSASPHRLGFKSFNARMGYGLIDADRAVNEGLEVYMAKMKMIEQNFQKRMKERERQQEEKKRKESEKKDG